MTLLRIHLSSYEISLINAADYDFVDTFRVHR